MGPIDFSGLLWAGLFMGIIVGFAIVGVGVLLWKLASHLAWV